MMHVTRIPVLTNDPFSASDLSTHLRVDASMDAEAHRQALAAAAEIEAHGSLALLTQAVRVTLIDWQREPILHLPVGPVAVDASCTILVNGAAYTTFTILPGIRPVLWFEETPPDGPIIIDYEAGFGATAEHVPPDLRLAIIDQAAAFFDARGAGDGKTLHLSPHAARIVARYRRVGL